MLIKFSRLKHLSKLKMGQSPLSEDIARFNHKNGLPFLQGNAEFGEISPEYKHTCKKPPKIAKTGDLLVSVRAPVGALNIADQAYGIGRGLCAITWTELEPQFGWWAMHHYREDLLSAATGSTYDAVSAEDLGNLLIAIPNASTQNIISHYLDQETARIDALIAEKKNMLSLLEEKRAAVISQAVTRGLDPDVPLKDSGFDWIGLTPRHWKILSLKRISTRIETGATPSPKYMNISTPESCIWFTPGDFEEIFIKSSKRKIPCEAITDKQAKIFPAESIMVIGIGATLGKVASCLDNFSANQQINIICPNNDISAQFLLFLLSSYKYVFRAHANSATLPILNQRDLGVIHIPLPPKHEQLAIVEKINNDQTKILNTMKMLDRSIQILKERRSALITAAVTGQIPIEEMTA